MKQCLGVHNVPVIVTNDEFVLCVSEGRPLEVFINININDISSISEMLMVSRINNNNSNN